MFNSNPKGQIKTKNNVEVALILYSIAFSDSGKEKMRLVFSKYSRPIISRLNKFLDDIKKQRESEESILTLEEEETLRNQIKDFISKINNIKDSDIDEMDKIIKEKYFLDADTLLIEGFILGIYDFLRKFFQPYYDFIENQQKILAKKDIEDLIFDKLSDKTLVSKKLITGIFNSMNDEDKLKIKNYEGESLDKINEVINNNLSIIAKYVDHEREDFSDIIKRILGFDEINRKIIIDKDTLKQYDKLEKRIQSRLESRDIRISDRESDFNEEVFGLIENLIYEILRYRKEVITKDLYKQLTKTY